MNTFRLILATPDGSIYDGDATVLAVRGVAGELAVMAGHVPFITTVVSSDCKVEFADGSERHGHTDGGLLTVAAGNTVTLLSGSFRWLEDAE